MRVCITQQGCKRILLDLIGVEQDGKRFSTGQRLVTKRS